MGPTARCCPKAGTEFCVLMYNLAMRQAPTVVLTVCAAISSLALLVYFAPLANVRSQGGRTKTHRSTGIVSTSTTGASTYNGGRAAPAPIERPYVGPIFRADQNSGPAPLTVIFMSFSPNFNPWHDAIDFGDGERESNWMLGDNSGAATLTHTYGHEGIYSAKLIMSGGVAATLSITVRGSKQ